MKKPIGPGRPKLPKNEARSFTLRVRISKGERDILLSAAKADKTPSEWARKKLLSGL